jgi:GDP/UDP-N,N'-diacetylbacillosamine 2-epimerase (hydrolysing)
MKLLFLTGSRSDWGYIKPILTLCKKKNIKYTLCVTNMHVLDSFGLTSNEIKNDGFQIHEEIYMTLDGYNNFTTSKSLGIFIQSFSDILHREKPDWIVLAGDRSETLAACISAAYSNIPIAHIQAGELSGNIDGQARHAIGKFAHIHFASNLDAAERLKKLGEQEFRIKNVGAPQIDDIKNLKAKNQKKIFFDLGIHKIKDFFLIALHPVTEEVNKTISHFKIFNKALNKFNNPKIWILPNSDPGSYTLKTEILNNKKNDTHIFDNLERDVYLQIMKNCEIIIGNSSSGIIESTFLKKPAINIGRRQHKRLKAGNVIDVDLFDEKKIVKAINRGISKKFKNKVVKIKSLYGDGNSSEKIINLLKSIKLDDKMLFKELTY